MSSPILYIAGPDVFYPSAVEILMKKKNYCESLGISAVIPVDNGDSVNQHPTGLDIYLGNLSQMNQADIIVANISPFRGPHMDPGTAFEIGYFAALKKPIFCYSETLDVLSSRVESWSGQPPTTDKDGSLRDKEGSLIENFDFHENLMISGASLISSLGKIDCSPSFEDAIQKVLELTRGNKLNLSNLRLFPSNGGSISKSF